MKIWPGSVPLPKGSRLMSETRRRVLKSAFAVLLVWTLAVTVIAPVADATAAGTDANPSPTTPSPANQPAPTSSPGQSIQSPLRAGAQSRQNIPSAATPILNPGPLNMSVSSLDGNSQFVRGSDATIVVTNDVGGGSPTGLTDRSSFPTVSSLIRPGTRDGPVPVAPANSIAPIRLQFPLESAR